MSLWDEILEQPAILDRALRAEGANVARLATWLKGRDVRFMVIAARGTSGNAARYAMRELSDSARVPLNNIGVAHPRVVRIESSVAAGSALVEQVPTLVQAHLQPLKPLSLDRRQASM